MKMLLVVASLQLLLAPVFMQPTDYWEEWGPYGECSRTCGIGVTMRTRQCITQRTDGGNNCVGPDRSYRTCNIQDCPEGSRDFREEQCSKFDGSDFQGKFYKWLPYYGAENPCELNCIPRGENFFYRHLAAVVDGTPCHPGGKDVCVDGVCRRLGCDNMLESTQQEDPCLQCGGNGQSCYLVRNTFSVRDLPKGYNQMFIIPVGATTISIREAVASRNYLAIKNLRGEYYLNGHWVIEFSRATPIAGTMLYYQRGSEGESAPETIIGRGPTTEPLVIELITQEPNQGVEYEYYLPHGRSREGYYWSYGSWSSCSSECGTGYQSRLVFCAIDNEAYPDYLCASLPRPLSNRTCNTQQCPETRSWKVGEWNQCSVTCGGGSQVRRVECVSHDASGSRVVEDSLCVTYAPRPLSQQNCNMQQCAEYRVSNWSQCSVTCGTGQQTRDVMCVGARGVRLEDYACRALLAPVKVQTCQMPVCRLRISWHVGDWGLCSKSCGSGLRERQVICSDKQRNLYGVELCSAHPKPPTVESCNTQPCYSPQLVPSMQDPSGHDNTLHGFLPFLPEESSTDALESPQVNTVYDPHGSGLTPHCSQTQFGCCPDGRTPARGRRRQGCPHDSAQPACTRSSYGCCEDGLTAAQGPNREGCQEYSPLVPTVAIPVAPAQPTDCRSSTYGCCFDGVTAASGLYGEGCPNSPNSGQRSPSCNLPHTAGNCDQWTSRFYFDPITSRCIHFWYGGCQGNSNNFMTREECQRVCQPAEPIRSRDMSRVFTVQRSGSATPTRIRLGASAATQAHRARLHMRARRPAASAVQYTNPAASWTAVGVSIDKSDPSTVEGLVGQQVVLPCRVSPSPSSTVVVEWRRDGIPIDPLRHQQLPDGSLLVGPVTVQDSGWFLCVATHDRERDHRYIYLSVSAPKETPKVVEDRQVPKDDTDRAEPYSIRFSIDHSGSRLVEGRAGQTARLHCRITPAAALPSVSIKWTKDGQPLSSYRHTQHSDGTLEISQLKSDDSGVYTCSASTRQQLEQKQIQLRVLRDLMITTAPSDVKVVQGSFAQLPCVVSGDNVNVGWSRNGVPVRPDGARIQVSADGTLVLNNVQPSDEGAYTCNAYSGTYSVSATAEVRVVESPEPDTSIPEQCVDQPELANCKLIVYARLCSSQYYFSFCCASCAHYAKSQNMPVQFWYS